MSSYDPLPKAMRQPKPATKHTQLAQQSVLDTLNWSDTRSFDDAKRGFIATLDVPTILHSGGRHAAYDLTALSFLEGEAPATVNPSLWRQAQLNAQHHGLYEVAEGIYQLRSFDIANMTLIRGERGWIVIDPLTSSESSSAALALANQQLGERPVTAVIYTHSHADHFAGVLGVIMAEQAASGEVQVVAPLDFVDESLSENVLAGNAMNRRATYMYGNLLEPSPTGFVSCGLGARLALGTTGFIVPNDTVKETGETRVIDGVTFEFQMTMGTEAPSEFVFYLPEHKALCMSEITSHHLHNVYTPRGAQVRDALDWAAQIHESIELFGERLEVQFASHHWPIWGQAEVVEYLAKQRDLYKFIHDQTLRLANLGYNKEEIAEQLKLPDSLAQEFYNRDYYGTVHHNARAVYVKYLGYFDGNPATLYKRPQVDAAERYVAFMGGADSVVEKARACYDEGDYRWVAEVLNHVVMSEPQHIEGRALLADTFEQLGYQCESAPWRNFYLCGTLELREGLPEGSTFQASAGMAASIPLDNLFQTMAVRLNADRVAGVSLSINLDFSDAPPTLLTIDNSVLHAFVGQRSDTADAAVVTDSISFKLLMVGATTAAELMTTGKLSVSGEVMTLAQLGGYFDQFERRYPLVTPRKDWRTSE